MARIDKFNPLTWLNVMVSEPFYFSHFLVFFSYFALRISTVQPVSSPVTTRLLYREIQVFLSFLVLTAIKIVREETWEAFVADIIFYAKILLLAATLLVDYHLIIWYIMAFLVIYLLSSQPACEELGTASKLTPLQLETMLTEGNTSKFWLVEFHALCSSTCIRTSRLFPELSITYSNKKLSFGIVDLGLFPNAAEKFGIHLDGNMGQLPIYVLFENSEEISRFPESDFGVKCSHHLITKKILIQHFELDRCLLEYLQVLSKTRVDKVALELMPPSKPLVLKKGLPYQCYSSRLAVILEVHLEGKVVFQMGGQSGFSDGRAKWFFRWEEMLGMQGLLGC